MTAVVIFCALSFLLLAGKLLRTFIPVFQRLYLPSSVIGGLAGLLLLSAAGKYVSPQVVNGMKQLPGFLINVIFASLFLGAATPGLGKILRTAFPQICLGQLLAWGQYAVGLTLAGFVFLPLFGLNPAFGNLLEIGFQGGHGTVGGMTAVFRRFKWEDGIALGYTVATCGMIVGIVVGMALINWALKKGHVRKIRAFSQRKRPERIGIYLPRRSRPSAGLQTVFCDSIDSLAFHIALIGMSILLGLGMLKGLQFAEAELFPASEIRLFSGFPLFPLCMTGGVLLQMFLRRARIDHLVNREQMQRISGASLDYLVTSAVATIQLKVVADNFLPLLLLVAAGSVFCVAVIVFVAPKLLKTDWFEKAIADFGQATGVTATGLMLLRTVDPENKTEAAATFGYKQLVHEPIMGGGIWTALALTMVFTFGWFPVWILSCVMLLVWGVVAAVIIRRP
ncbi:MAG: sodium:glutamate symporter [Lentisphaeria bacterium]|nr:sodium:glutamate symporter [Lentisphaeria bacterium]